MAGPIFWNPGGTYVRIAGTNLGWTEHTARDDNGKPIEFRSTDQRDAIQLAKAIAQRRAMQQKGRP